MRATISPVIEVAASAAKLATTVSARPASITGRRPKRSDSVPSTSCEIAMPSRNSESVSCTVPAPAPSVTIRPGIAGARMLSESGPTAVDRRSAARAARQGCSSRVDDRCRACRDRLALRAGPDQARSGLVAASSQARVSAATSGVSLARNARVIGVEPGDLVGGHQLRLDQAAVDRREASASRTRSAASRRPRSSASITSTRFSMRMP